MTNPQSTNPRDIIDQIETDMENQRKVERDSLNEEIVQRAIPQIMDSPLSEEIKAAQVSQLRKDLNK